MSDLIWDKLTELQKNSTDKTVGCGGNAYPDISSQLNLSKRASVLCSNSDASIVFNNPALGPGSGMDMLTSNPSVRITIGPLASTGENSKPDIFVNPSPTLDGAYIDIRKFANPDETYAMADPEDRDSIKDVSSIAMGADAIRFVSKDGGIRLITHAPGVANSSGKDINSSAGIHMIAGNNKKSLEPMVLGNKLRITIKNLNKRIDKLATVIQKISAAQIKLMVTLASHTHMSPVGTTSPSFELVPDTLSMVQELSTEGLASVLTARVNILIDEFNSTQNIGADSILSGLNRVN